jgi:hypothetical protein
MAAAALTTATGEQNLANETIAAGNTAATGSFISSAIKGVAAIASLATGGATAVVGQAATSAMGDPRGIGGLY